MAEKILDMERMETISSGDVALEKELFSLFFDTADRCTKVLEQSMVARDHNHWATTAHELKGAAGNLGADEVYALCQLSCSAIPEDRPRLLEGIKRELAKVKEFVKERYAI